MCPISEVPADEPELPSIRFFFEEVYHRGDPHVLYITVTAVDPKDDAWKQWLGSLRRHTAGKSFYPETENGLKAMLYEVRVRVCPILKTGIIKIILEETPPQIDHQMVEMLQEVAPTLKEVHHDNEHGHHLIELTGV